MDLNRTAFDFGHLTLALTIGFFLGVALMMIKDRESRTRLWSGGEPIATLTVVGDTLEVGVDDKHEITLHRGGTLTFGYDHPLAGLEIEMPTVKVVGSESGPLAIISR